MAVMSSTEFESLVDQTVDQPVPSFAGVEAPESMKAAGFDWTSLLGLVGPFWPLIGQLIQSAALPLVSSSLPALREYVAGIVPSNRVYAWIQRGVLAAIDAMIATPALARHFFGE